MENVGAFAHLSVQSNEVKEMVQQYVQCHPPDAHHGGGIHGRTHTTPPAAVAQLKARLAQNGHRQPAKTTNPLAARILAQARQRKQVEMVEESEMSTNTDEQKELTITEAHQRYMAGESVKALGEEVGITWQALMKQWREIGLPRRPAIKDGQVGRESQLMREAEPAVAEQAVVGNGRIPDRLLDTVAVADGMDRMISLGRLVRELQGAGVGVKVSGRVVVELEF